MSELEEGRLRRKLATLRQLLGQTGTRLSRIGGFLSQPWNVTEQMLGDFPDTEYIWSMVREFQEITRRLQS